MKVCRWFRFQSTRPGYCSIRVGYPQRLREIAAKYEVSPSWITLEILEGLTLEDVELVKQSMAELHSYGFRISMDDFGTGYSS